MNTSSFDYSKAWCYLNPKKYFQPSDIEIEAIIKMISNNFGGYIDQKTCFRLCNKHIRCEYTIVIIKTNPFILITKIGQGAFGKVYKGFDIKNRKLVAVKSQPFIYQDIISKQAKITRENGIGLADYSSNIGPSFLSDGNGYFTLPLADLSFNTWIVHKSLTGEYSIIIKALIKIADDLIKLHSKKQVHMDLKSDNVLVINDKAYLSDFGKVEKEGSLIKTADGCYKRYPHCDPEYFKEVNPYSFYTVDHKFDLFSYGFLLNYVSKVIRNKKMSQEILNISSYLHKYEKKNRVELKIIVMYLNRLL